MNDDPYTSKEGKVASLERLSMNEQLMYKLASMDATVQAGFRRLDEKMDRFQNDLRDNQIETNDRINKQDKDFSTQIAAKRVKIDTLEKEVHRVTNCMQEGFNEIDTWRQVAMAKVSVLVAGVALVWTFVAPTLRHILGLGN